MFTTEVIEVLGTPVDKDRSIQTFVEYIKELEAKMSQILNNISL
jgi:hypothetical protein